MSEELAVQELGLATRQDDTIFNELTIVGGWLPRVQLFTGKSKLVEKELFPGNHWGLVQSKDKILDLGLSFVAYPLAYRAMALNLSGKKAVSYYDPVTPEFKDVVAKSGIKDSQCMSGIQFLLYIKEQGFATLFCASKSSKAMAPTVRAKLRSFVEFSSQTVDTGKWVYRAPTVIESPVTFELPPVEELNKKIESFTAPQAKQETDKDLENPDGPTGPVNAGTTESGRPR